MRDILSKFTKTNPQNVSNRGALGKGVRSARRSWIRLWTRKNLSVLTGQEHVFKIYFKWQVITKTWQYDIKIRQVNIIIWQVMAEICHHTIQQYKNIVILIELTLNIKIGEMRIRISTFNYFFFHFNIYLPVSKWHGLSHFFLLRMLEWISMITAHCQYVQYDCDTCIFENLHCTKSWPKIFLGML